MRWVGLIVAVCLFAVTAQASVDCTKGCLVGKYYKSWHDMQNTNGTYQWKKEANIDYDWGYSAPRTFLDNFGVQWEGTIDMTNIKTIVADCDDAARLTIGGKVVLSSFEDPADAKTGANLFIHADDLPMWASNAAWTGKQSFKLEYREYYGAAKCRLLYSQAVYTADQIFNAYVNGNLQVNSNFTVVPQSAFSPPGLPTTNQLEEYTDATPESTFFNTWVNYATVSKDLDINPTYFAAGYWDLESTIKQCHTMGYIGTGPDNNVNPAGANVMLRITMGDYVDYYRPLPGHTLCEMLQSSSLHQYAPSETGPWYNVTFSKNGYGGSEDNWLSAVSFGDWRRYPAFWYFQGGDRKGGCCYGTGQPMVADEWRKDYWERSRGANHLPYKIDVRYTTRHDINATTQHPTLTLTEPSKTNHKWDVYAQVNADIKVNLNRSYIKGWRLNYLHENLHPNFIQKCSVYDSLGSDVVMRYRFGVGHWSAKDNTTTFVSGFSGQPGFETWYRPRENHTFCDMISGFTQHEWSDDGITWYIPHYHNALCGGSQWDWPRQFPPATTQARTMNVYHLPFWCGDRGGYGKYDGADAAAGQGRWGRGFQLLVRAAPGERWATQFPSSGTFKKGTWVNQFLALGGENIALNITKFKTAQDWRISFIDMHMIPNENTTLLHPKAGDVVTEAQLAGVNATLADGLTQVAWAPYRNLQLPTYFGMSDQSLLGNYWVRYYSICLRSTTNNIAASAIWDDQIAVWIGGKFVTRFTAYSENLEKPINLPVTAGQWSQLVVKHVETEWGSQFGLHFPTQDVEFQLQC